MNPAALFDLTGYLKLPGVLNNDLVDRMRGRIESDFSHAVGPLRVNGKGSIARLDRLLERDTVFLEALRAAALRPVLERLLGPTVEVVRHRHNQATRNLAGDIPFRLHRDIQQWTQPLVSVFFFLEDSTANNGCTTVVPGTHRLPYAGPQSGDGGGNWADEHDEYSGLIGQELPLEMSRGGVILLNSLAFHSVGRNQTDGSRLSCVFAVRAVDELRTVRSEEDAVLVFGTPRNLSNDALIVSGSLAKGGDSNAISAVRP